MTEENPDEYWRTIGGRRVLFKKGDTVESAMARSGKFKKEKTEKKLTEEEIEIVDEWVKRRK